MNKPKYEVGDCIPNSNFYIRGRAKVNNTYRYFVQIGTSDNTIVANQEDLHETIRKIFNSA